MAKQGRKKALSGDRASGVNLGGHIKPSPEYCPTALPQELEHWMMREGKTTRRKLSDVLVREFTASDPKLLSDDEKVSVAVVWSGPEPKLHSHKPKTKSQEPKAPSRGPSIPSPNIEEEDGIHIMETGARAMKSEKRRPREDKVVSRELRKTGLKKYEARRREKTKSKKKKRASHTVQNGIEEEEGDED